jgi:lactoylglutathione lyase
LKLWCEYARVPTRLGYSILFVSGLDRAIGFYRDVIGVPLRFRADTYAEFVTEGAKFTLFPRSRLPALIGRRAPPCPAPWPLGEVAFLVGDVDAEHARLQAAGVCVFAGPTDRPWGERTLHVADPDGNVVNLARAKRSV